MAGRKISRKVGLETGLHYDFCGPSAPKPADLFLHNYVMFIFCNCIDTMMNIIQATVHELVFSCP